VDEANGERIRRLPPGPHGLSPELVARNQRERLIAAMAEVCGERGYATSSVAEVSKRAGVSTASFYRQFTDRKECLLASFEELFGRLLAGIEDACVDGKEPVDRARAGAAAAARLLGSDPPAARLLTIEIAAAGAEGVLAQHGGIERLARLLRSLDARPRAGEPDEIWAAVAAMTSLAGRRAGEGRSVSAAELEALGGML